MPAKAAADFWTLAQAINWICLRDPAQVETLHSPETPNTLRTQAWRFLSKRRFLIRQRLDSEPRSYWTTAGRFAETAGAVSQLQAWSTSQMLRVKGPSDKSAGFLTSKNMSSVTLVIPPFAPEDGFGFWSDKTGDWILREPQFQVADLIKLAPRQWTHATKVIEVQKHILERLHDLTQSEGKALKMLDAMSKCSDVPGYYREAFRNAWKDFPAEKKLKAGRPETENRRTKGKRRI